MSAGAARHAARVGLCWALSSAITSGPAAADTGMEVFNRIQKQRFFETEKGRILSDPEAAERRYLQLAFMLHPDGHVDRAAIARREKFDAARQRAFAAQKILGNDLNGDGTVSKDELDEIARILAPPQMAQIRARHLVADTDGDGALSIAEVMAHAGANPDFAPIGMQGQRRHEITVLLGMDLNGDGVTVPDEVITAIGMVVDANKR